MSFGAVCVTFVDLSVCRRVLCALALELAVRRGVCLCGSWTAVCWPLSPSVCGPVASLSLPLGRAQARAAPPAPLPRLGARVGAAPGLPLPTKSKLGRGSGRAPAGGAEGAPGGTATAGGHSLPLRGRKTLDAAGSEGRTAGRRGEELKAREEPRREVSRKRK